MTPRSASDLPPRIVCVLPVPVQPWAKMERSKPLKRCFTVGATRSRSIVGATPRFRRVLTLGVKELLLRGVLLVDGAELEAEGLGVVLGTRDAHDCGGSVALELLGRDDGVCIDLLFQQRTDPRDDAYAHGGGPGTGMVGDRRTDSGRLNLQRREGWTYRPSTLQLCVVRQAHLRASCRRSLVAFRLLPGQPVTAGTEEQAARAALHHRLPRPIPDPSHGRYRDRPSAALSRSPWPLLSTPASGFAYWGDEALPAARFCCPALRQR